MALPQRTAASNPAIWILLWVGVTFGAPVFAQSTVAAPTLRGPVSGQVVVPITVAPADGVTELELVLEYDPAIVTPTGAFTTGYTAGYSFVPELLPPDGIRLTLSGPVLQGTGEVAWIAFDVNGSAGTTSALSWRRCLLNGGLVPCQTVDGRVDVVSRTVTVSVPDDGQGEPGGAVVVPIHATAFTDVESIDLTLKYSPEVLAAVSVSETSLTSPLTLTSNVSEPGVVRISFFGTTAISGSGTLAEITFSVVGALSDVTPLDLTKALFNEASPSTVADDGSFLVCSEADGDGDFESSCDGDCDDGNALISSGATEVCDGVDNDCDGWVDDVVPPVGRPVLTVAKQGGTAALSWTAVSRATGYDVTRGGTDTLRQTDGDFSTSADFCLADDATSTSIEDDDSPVIGDGLWYLVRAVNCNGAGSYGSGSATEQPGRDSEIAGATGNCP